jgi:GTP-binding protein
VPQPVVAIVGRPNVGKSTLFNRIVGARVAVVHDEPGITRDRLGRSCEWNGRPFLLVDTGGWVPGPDETMDAAILDQVVRALEACDLVVFLVDAREGVHPHDEEIASALFRRDVRVLLVANKSDSPNLMAQAEEFRRLGFDQFFAVSAAEGLGLGELLDAVISGLPPPGESAEAEPETIRVAVLGRPNVGKSSLVNRLLREERMIVDDRPGTTRDAVDSPVRFHGRTLVLVDTAGLRRRLDSQPAWEFYASLRALRSLDRADVAVLVLDASQEIQKQDARIADRILQSGTGCIIAVNKWDLPEKDDSTAGAWAKRVREAIPFLAHAPMEFISALTAQRVSRIPEAIVRVYEERQREIPTAKWNEVLQAALEKNPPSAHRGMRPPRFYYATQVKTGPPIVALFVSDPLRVPENYLRYLNHAFREAFGFEGNPIRLVLKKSK